MTVLRAYMNSRESLYCSAVSAVLVKGGRGKVGVKKHKVQLRTRAAWPNSHSRRARFAGIGNQNRCQEQEQGQGQGQEGVSGWGEAARPVAAASWTSPVSGVCVCYSIIAYTDGIY